MIGSRYLKNHDLFGRNGPISISSLLVITYCVAMVIEVIFRAFGVGSVNYWLIFTPEATFERLNLWRLLMYPLVNEPSLWFLMEMGMLYFFGREVERFVGRRSFGVLYFALLLAPVAIITLFQLLGWTRVALAGSWNLNFAVFICFVVFYPRVEFFWGIAAKWVAIALVGIRSLELLEGRNWIFLIIFWLECLLAVLLVRAIRSGTDLGSLLNRSFLKFSRFLYRSTHQAVKNQPDGAGLMTSFKKRSTEKRHDSIDPILEKISRSGIGSLTRGERECLERARSALLEKERRL